MRVIEVIKNSISDSIEIIRVLNIAPTLKQK